MRNADELSLRKDVSLRKDIAGERPKPIAPRRARIGAPAETRQRMIRLGGLVGGSALLLVGAVAAAISMTASSPEAGSSGTVAGAAVSANTMTTLDSRTLASDGGRVHRATVIGLGGRVSESSADPVTLAARSAGTRQAPQMPSFKAGQPAAEPGDHPPASLVVAQANLVWARVFNKAELTYAPLRHAPRERWAESPCAQRQIEPGPSYCGHDRTVYLEPGQRLDPVGMLDLAHVVGHHVQNMAGVAITPLSGEAKEFQADCFAGMWASREPSVAERMEPDTLRRVMMDGLPLSLYSRSRVQAYTQGFVARSPADCSEISTAWLESAG